MVNSSNKDYYDKGSTQVTQVSAVTLKKLEHRRKLTNTSERMVIVLVGLPGRGKSFIARKLQTFFTWRGNACKVFNVGKYRRQVQAQINEEANKDGQREKMGACDANFFDANNPQANEVRQKSASLAMQDMLRWLDMEENIPESTNENDAKVTPAEAGAKACLITSRIAIFDATNSTVERRKWVLEEATSLIKRKGKTTGCIFVESVCDDEELLDENFKFKVRNSPDFKGMTEQEAIHDLRIRVKKYEEMYETIQDDSQSYIKIFNLSSKLLVNHIYGRMAKIIVPSLMSWNIGSRPIYLIRAGETTETTATGLRSGIETKPRRVTRKDKLGWRGLKFKDALADYIEQEGLELLKEKDDAMKIAFAPQNRATGTSVTGIAPPEVAWRSKVDTCEDDDDLSEEEIPFTCHVMSSTMPRAVETASWKKLPFYINEVPNLNPLDKGDFSGMELEEIREHDPDWYAMLEKDPFFTRFPGGECYADLIHRLETCIIDMEQQMNMVCVCSHVSVLQVLMAYFRRSPVNECTSIEVPMHTVIKYTPVTGGGWTESQHELCPELEGGAMNTSNNPIDFLERVKSKTPIWGDHKRRVSLSFSEEEGRSPTMRENKVDENGSCCCQN